MFQSIKKLTHQQLGNKIYVSLVAHNNNPKITTDICITLPLSFGNKHTQIELYLIKENNNWYLSDDFGTCCKLSLIGLFRNKEKHQVINNYIENIINNKKNIKYKKKRYASELIISINNLQLNLSNSIYKMVKIITSIMAVAKFIKIDK